MIKAVEKIGKKEKFIGGTSTLGPLKKIKLNLADLLPGQETLKYYFTYKRQLATEISCPYYADFVIFENPALVSDKQVFFRIKLRKNELSIKILFKSYKH